MPDILNFTTAQLIIGSHHPELTELELAVTTGVQEFQFDSTTYLISSSILEGRFFWLSCEFGKALPRNPLIFDAKTHKRSANPRTSNQVEPGEQLFCLYDNKSNMFLISNAKKISAVKSYLESKLNTEVIIKRVFKDINDIKNIYSQIDEVSFAFSEDLMNKDGDVIEGVRNIFGYDYPQEFKIKAKYHITSKGSVASLCQRLIRLYSTNEMKGLVVVGKDEDGVETIFNMDNLTRKVSVIVRRLENHMFDTDAVQLQLIQEVKKPKYAQIS